MAFACGVLTCALAAVVIVATPILLATACLMIQFMTDSCSEKRVWIGFWVAPPQSRGAFQSGAKGGET